MEVSPELTEKKLVRTHQEDHRKIQELAGSPLEDYRKIIESPPEDH